MSKDPLITDETAFVREALAAEAEAISRLAARAEGPDADAWRSAIELIAECSGHVAVSGMGKSGLIGAKISATLSSLGRPSHALHPAEAVHGDLGRIRTEDVVILLSYSGETEELVALASILKADDVPTIGISRAADSSLGRLCTTHLAIGDIIEACPLNLAPTASTNTFISTSACWLRARACTFANPNGTAVYDGLCENASMSAHTRTDWYTVVRRRT